MAFSGGLELTSVPLEEIKSSTIVVGGESQKAYGQACRQPDGSWKVVN